MPYGLAPSGKAPTGVVSKGPESWLFRREESNSLPHGKARASAPRAAFSHSSSVGKRHRVPVRRDSHFAYATASARLPQADYYRIEITVNIDAGYHINANPASFDYLIPTSVSFDDITPASIAYPEPVLFKPQFARGGIKVYEGNPTLTARIAKRDVGNRKSIRATVAAQACDAEVCLPPSKLEIAIPMASGR